MTIRSLAFALGLACMTVVFAMQARADEEDHSARKKQREHEHAAMPDMDDRSDAMPGMSIYQLESKWTGDDGRAVPLSSLRGQTLVVAMIYTSCDYACPLIVGHMKRVEAALPSGAAGQIRFVLFSFDPERDTPKALKTYRAEHGLDPTRWRLLTSDSDSVLELAAVLGVRFRKEATNDFAHSNIISVIDAQGVIRHQKMGLQGGNTELLEALAAVTR